MASSTSPKQKLVIVYGIRRSGNHALIRWVMDCFEGVRLHLNDIHTKLADPYLCFLSGEVTNVSSYEIHRTHLGINRHLLEATTIQPRQKLSVFNPGLDRDALRSINKDLLLLSYEEVSFSNPRLARFLAYIQTQLKNKTEKGFFFGDPYRRYQPEKTPSPDDST